MKNWDNNKKNFIETPKKLIDFFNEIDNICKKYNYSISHEDEHGAFEIEKYNDININWLKNANIQLNEE